MVRICFVCGDKGSDIDYQPGDDPSGPEGIEDDPGADIEEEDEQEATQRGGEETITNVRYYTPGCY